MVCFRRESAELVGNSSNKPSQVFGLEPFLFCQVLEVTNSRSARVQGCTQNTWCVSMPFGETFIVINLVTFSECVRLCVQGSPTQAWVQHLVVNHEPPPPLKPSHTCSMQKRLTMGRKHIIDSNIQGRSTSLKSSESIFLYCSQAVRICLNETQLKGI